MTDVPLPDAPRQLSAPDGTPIAYHAVPGVSPAIVFLGGFRSDMTGSKASALDAHARATGRAFLRFDYFGHGRSGGRIEDGTIGRWKDDVLLVLDRLTAGPVVLAGSSLGGWLMTLAALARPDRVRGLVGIAAAPDFTEDLVWPGLNAAQRRALDTACVVYLPSAYDPAPTPITRALVEDGRRHLVLRRAIPLDLPVRLRHGMADPDVPWATALRIAGQLASGDVTVALVKGGGHRLSEPADLAWLAATLDELAAP